MTAALEDQKPLDITDWLTLNTASSPTKLPIGQTPNAKNTWVDEKPGSVITAPGFRKVGAIPSGNPVTFCINYFKTSSGTQTFVVSDNSTVWTTVDFQAFTSIITGLSPVFQLRGMVIRDKLWLTNGSDAVRTYDGTSVVVLDGSGVTPNVPKGRYIAYHDERVWLYHIPSNRSQLAFSGLTDSSGTIIAPDTANAWPTSNTLQISEGDADYGTGLALYRGYLYMFKQYSIWRLIGYDEYTYTRVKCRASTGTRFAESIQVVDSLIHMIGVDGIYVFDGEEADRISDMIDPASAAQASFGFNALQQPNANNQFWEVTAAVDWSAGVSIPTNLKVADQSLSEIACDDSQADFESGVLKTNISTSGIPGKIQISRQGSGGSAERLGAGGNAYLDDSGNGGNVLGNPAWLTDGDTGRLTGLSAGSSSSFQARYVVDLPARADIGRVILRSILGSDPGIPVVVEVNTGTYQTRLGNQGTWVQVGTLTPAQNVGADFVFDFATLNAIQVSIRMFLNPRHYIQLSEIEAYAPKFQTSGKFVSKALDLGIAPASLGDFSASGVVLNSGNGIQFFTQSSDDGIAWDAETAITAVPGDSGTYSGPIVSTPRRFLRWGVHLACNADLSPEVGSAYLPAIYLSAIHNTGGSIFAWGPFESADTSYVGKTIKFYYRAAATSGAVPAASWNLIVPGGVLSIATSLVFVQFKIEILGGDSTHLPIVPSVTINWIKGTGVQAQTLQNVASFFWRNRYWMSAASKGSASNDTILVRGKKTFKSPWQLKDWPILSFCRFLDGFYGGSSIDGSIYQLDTGYSKDGASMDSFFETGDFTFMGNHIHCHEVELEVERTGSYNLKFGISIDRGATWKEYDIPVTASTFIPSYWVKLNVDPGTTPYIRFRVRTNGVDQPFEVHNLRAYYEVRTSRGSLR